MQKPQQPVFLPFQRQDLSGKLQGSFLSASGAYVLYCLLTQAIRSLMVCEKQMSAYAAACFSLHTLNHTINDQGNGNADNTCHSDLDGKSQSNDQYAKVND